MIRTEHFDPTSFFGGRSVKAMAGALLTFAAAGATQAATINFEGYSGTVNSGASIQQSGYTVGFVSSSDTPGPAGQFVDGSNLSGTCGGKICPSNNPSVFFDLSSDAYLDIVPASAPGARFSFSGLDASFIAMPGMSYPPTAGAIQVIGFLDPANPENYLTQQFDLAGPNNGSLSFQHFDADADFAAQQFVEVAILGFSCNSAGHCVALDGRTGQVALDNISLSDLPVNNVPEPASAMLVSLGLLGIGARARRRA